jgi:hypothetical protein
MPGLTADFLSEKEMPRVANLTEFAGILALDKWTGNADGRQAVFVRKARDRNYRAVFIDFGYCFRAGDWAFDDQPLRGVYYRNDVYHDIMSWDAFEPWLSRIELMPIEEIWAYAAEIPPEWYGNQAHDLEMLIEKLSARRSKARELIRSFGASDRRPFPKWMSSSRPTPQRGSVKLPSEAPEKNMELSDRLSEVFSQVSTANALHKFSFQLIRYVPNPVRNEFVNIGVLLRRTPSEVPGEQQVELRVTRDWRRVRGLDQDADTALLEGLEVDLRSVLRQGPEEQATKILESLSLNIQLTDPKAFLAECLPAAIEELMRVYVD